MKPVNIFWEYISSKAELSPEFTAVLSALLSVERIHARQLLHVPGQTANRMWFVTQGLLRCYEFDLSGREHTVGFYREQMLFFSLEALRSEPGEYYVEALEDTLLYALRYQALNGPLAAFKETKTISGELLRLYERDANFKRQLLLSSAPDRYRMVREKQNWLFSRVSVRMIATYLNMSRENLSRLMARTP